MQIKINFFVFISLIILSKLTISGTIINDDLKKSLDMVINDNECINLFSVSKAKKNPYFNMLEKNKKKFLVPSKKIKNWPTSRQSAPVVYDQVASMYLLKTKFLRSKSKLYDGKIAGYSLKDFQNFDIDSQLDYKIITYLYENYYLKKTT